MKETVRRLLEGRALWGTLDVSPATRGIWQQVRLTVYPPGTTPGQRRLLHLGRSWPSGGAALCLVVLVFLGDQGPVVSVAAAATMYLAGLVVTARLTRDLRARCRRIAVASELVACEVREFGDVPLLRAAATRLLELEARRRSGLVDPVRYEAEWSEVYDALPAADVSSLERR